MPERGARPSRLSPTSLSCFLDGQGLILRHAGGQKHTKHRGQRTREFPKNAASCVTTCSLENCLQTRSTPSTILVGMSCLLRRLIFNWGLMGSHLPARFAF
eukprot:1086608-Amphidinium_carterae.1